jgi:type I restriction enzyme S subunit
MTVMRVDVAFSLNPAVDLKRGSLAPFVDMASVRPFTRDVYSDREKPFTGGAKFIDGDVLMARITPSLENGKTSVYRAAAGFESSPAFGSTEFIVVRGQEGLSDSLFAYYFFTSQHLREHAINSMNGSSGRQRVQLDSLAAFTLDLPSLDAQREIAATLGVLDDKIESNGLQRELLRSLGNAEYLRALELGTRSQPLSALTLSIARGIAPKYADQNEGTRLVINQKCIRDGWISVAPARRMHNRSVAPSRRAGSGDVLVNSTGTGTLGRLARWHEGEIFVDGHVSVVKANPDVVQPTVLAYALLHRQTDIEELATGSTGQTELSPARLGSLRVTLPTSPLANKLEDTLLGFERRAALLASENAKLEALRTTLLPELLSGRVRIPDKKIA